MSAVWERGEDEVSVEEEEEEGERARDFGVEEDGARLEEANLFGIANVRENPPPSSVSTEF